MKLVCGIDVSKDTLDVYYNDDKGRTHYTKLSNTASGHRELLEKCGERVYVLETSGPYYLALAFTLKEAGGDVRVENPMVVKRFIQMNLERNKSDKKDARWLFRYGVEREASVWRVPSQAQLKCSQIGALINMYVRQKTMLQNQLHALTYMPFADKEVTKSLKASIARIERELKKLEAQMDAELKQWSGNQMKNLRSVPGLGKRAVATLIVATDGFTKVSNYRQLIALAGLAPREHTSGTSIKGKRGICKMGNGYLRSVLFMCALTAKKYNAACKDLYDRLVAKGKLPYVALIAVCNKLLKQAFAIATKGTVYQADFKSALA
ncbi:IS110 family transposase [Flaviaesturariibacter flavus]|uniref:IS110 family transposase n=3 Tax=Flaviaesturariibacter flavus TaxID=2502780 RepID=A0A4R1B618_9BACT|nr:IS110 family transposase [Flaviaesturariibacter flavus]TCJ13020.1 IS110 family transposase [Flaviaesturariibacter flavus]TCJ14999.1 IS110 family transposase [Flaviaesturariibacter flavus]TCJ16098.1 IS110 family transposase [Flaviaesturariibacter flavus]TCJ16205.1 IS110 family transposase [Flaviaesturariibacter flavus]